MIKKGVLLVSLTAIISGFSIFINKLGVNGIDSTIFTFLKNIIVSVFLIGIIIGLKESKSILNLKRKDWFSLILIGLLGGSIPFVLFFKGLQLSSGALGSFMHKSMFVFVAIIASIFLKEKINKKIFIPAVFLLVGNFLILNIRSFEFNTAILFVFIATIFWAVENVVSKHLLKAIEPKILAFGRLFFGSFFILAYMLVIGKVPFSLNFQQFSWILITAPLLLLYVLTWYNGLKHVKVITATSILLLGSPITTLLSYIFLGSSISLMEVIGILCTLSGIACLILLSEKKYHLASSTA
ncbi:MAG: DMT family transporter [Nanoarchaeota archaeon]